MGGVKADMTFRIAREWPLRGGSVIVHRGAERRQGIFNFFSIAASGEIRRDTVHRHNSHTMRIVGMNALCVWMESEPPSAQ